MVKLTNMQSSTVVQSAECTAPLTLTPGWNNISIDLPGKREGERDAAYPKPACTRCTLRSAVVAANLRELCVNPPAPACSVLGDCRLGIVPNLQHIIPPPRRISPPTPPSSIRHRASCVWREIRHRRACANTVHVPPLARLFLGTALCRCRAASLPAGPVE